MSDSPPHRLGEVPLLAGLPQQILDQMAKASLERSFRDGQVLFNEGDPGHSLVVLEQGQLRVSRFSLSGQEAVLAVVEAPAALGELALLDGKPRDATVTAQGPVKVRLIQRADFLALLRSEFAFVEGLLATLAAWVRQANARHADLVNMDVPGRLAKWLLERAERAGSLTFDLGRTQGELAQELSTTRSTLNRELNRFVSLAYTEIDGDRVTILKPEALRAHLG